MPRKTHSARPHAHHGKTGLHAHKSDHHDNAKTVASVTKPKVRPIRSAKVYPKASVGKVTRLDKIKI